MWVYFYMNAKHGKSDRQDTNNANGTNITVYMSMYFIYDTLLIDFTP